MRKGNILDNSIMQTPVLVKALVFIPPASREEAIRLLDLLADSGADEWTALAALYRHTAGRPERAAIHRGLRRFFDDEVNY
jgi:hypothetical protein